MHPTLCIYRILQVLEYCNYVLVLPEFALSSGNASFSISYTLNASFKKIHATDFHAKSVPVQELCTVG